MFCSSICTCALIYLLCLCPRLQAQGVFIDENYDEWTQLNQDPAADNPFGADILACAADNDENRIYFYLELKDELLLQSNDDVALFIDVDNNTATGRLKDGIGADLAYFFSGRFGAIYHNSSTTYIDHEDIYLVQQPSVRSTQFEIGLNRSLLLNGSTTKMQTIRYLIESSGDQIPNTSGGFTYSCGTATPAMPETRYAKAASDLRICSYNVHFDDIFDSFRQSSFLRILGAINADIIGFQEVYDHSSGDLADLVRIAQGIPATTQLYHASAGVDVHMVSKYPIRGVQSIDGNGAFHMLMPQQQDASLVDVLVINAHLPCCERDEERQDEIDRILQFIRKQKEGLGPFDLADEFPIIVLGDMNFVGSSENPYSLIHGAISNTSLYGTGFHPNWDGGPFSDIVARATGTRNSCTWFSKDSDYSPSRIDYLLYTHGRMRAKNSFVLNVEQMSAADRSELNLLATDADNASDHLPLVVDVRIQDDWSATETPAWADALELLQFSDHLLVLYNGVVSGVFDLHLFEASNGQQASSQRLLLDAAGARIDTKNLKAGVYLISLNRLSDGSRYTKKIFIEPK